MNLILIGAGQRGMIYSKYAFQLGHRITAVAEPDDDRREAARAAFGIPEANCYRTAEELLSLPRTADAAIIATMDRCHYPQAIPALKLGYDLLLEKPISPVPAAQLTSFPSVIRKSLKWKTAISGPRICVNSSKIRGYSL